MRNWIGLFGFPSSEKQESMNFCVFKNISYSTRIAMYLMLIILGFAIQIFTTRAWPGAIFLICATLLNLMKGCDARISLKSFNPDSNWTPVNMKQINEVKKLNDTMVKWSSNILDITSVKGGVGFLFTIIAITFIPVIIGTYFDDLKIAIIFIVDAIILITPFWFSGNKYISKQEVLNNKVDIIKILERHFQNIKMEGEEFKPALMLARGKDGKTIPTDARFIIHFENMPTDFYGIQAQTNINMVQGARYPYFYCVIPAKVGYGLQNHLNKIPKSKNITVEFQADEQAEVIVIRQYTTKSSGYHTKIKDSKNILNTTLKVARMILK